MPFITREDGEHFVIPSYREVLTAKQKSVLKKDILALSQNYGEYLTMQRKGPQEYEVAFSPDVGYLLGETVWSHFDRPVDMIYAEVIPNTNDAILVIVKNGSVYLDGSFPIDSIPEELVVFLTQENNFEIYIYGDLPIAASPTDGKFNFDEGAIKSFLVLDEPVFNTLPLLPAYHLAPVDKTLKAYGIGTIHMLPIILVAGLFVVAWIVYGLVQVAQKPPEAPMEPNPYQGYVDALASPSPDLSVKAYLDGLKLLFTMPGWDIKTINYRNSTIDAVVFSGGNNLQTLLEWCGEHGVSLTIRPTGVALTIPAKADQRPKPRIVYPLKQVMVILLDRLRDVYPGDHIRLVTTKSVGPYTNITVKIGIDNATPALIGLIGDQLKGLPLTLDSITLTKKEETFNGLISVSAYGT